MTPEQEQAVASLRSLNLSPKQIARKLDLRPAEVTALIQSQAQAASLSPTSGHQLAPLHQCLINKSAAQRLLNQRSFWQTKGKDDLSGMAQVLVTRVDKSTYLTCSYLIDYWCLGVKNTFGPRKLDTFKYESLLRQAQKQFGEEFQEITLKQAQSVVFGALDYADALGFEPHSDFNRSKVQLGDRPEQLAKIEFGREGKPFYISGPYDNPDKIIAKLNAAVGEGNYHFIAGVKP